MVERLIEPFKVYKEFKSLAVRPAYVPLPSFLSLFTFLSPSLPPSLPPFPLSLQVDNAIELLEDVGALNKQEELTALGQIANRSKPTLL